MLVLYQKILVRALEKPLEKRLRRAVIQSRLVWRSAEQELLAPRLQPIYPIQVSDILGGIVPNLLIGQNRRDALPAHLTSVQRQLCGQLDRSRRKVLHNWHG